MADMKSAPTSSPLAILVTAFYIAIVIFAWGTNYPLTKLAIQDMPPLTFSVVRLFGGAFVIFVVIFLGRSTRFFPPRDELLGLAAVGILQFSSVLGLAAIALMVLPAGRTVTAIYTMPLWAALFDVFLLRARLAPLQVCGIAVSLSGLLLFLDPVVLDWTAPGVAVGMGLTLMAAMLWGLGAVLYRRRSWNAPMLCQVLWQLITAGLVIAGAALMLEAPLSSRSTPMLWMILVWNWLVPMALAVWAWSKVLNRLPASMAGQFLMSSPFVGIGVSAWIFDEKLPPAFVVSAVLIALGGLMVLLRRS